MENKTSRAWRPRQKRAERTVQTSCLQRGVRKYRTWESGGSWSGAAAFSVHRLASNFSYSPSHESS